MKKIAILSTISILLFSCDPDVPGEGITLPEMKFGFKVSPDTSFIKLGDTLMISTTISNKLSNGVLITNGRATIDWGHAYYPESPITDFDLGSTARFTSDFFAEAYEGGLNINSSSGILVDIYAVPIGDSIKFLMSYVPLKAGTYHLAVRSKFFEGTEGKARTQSYFDMEDRHWDLWQDTEYPAPSPTDDGYTNRYLFSVYE